MKAKLDTRDELMQTLDRMTALSNMATATRLCELDEVTLFHYFEMMNDLSENMKRLLQH